jgi:hypothetical protein
MNTVLTRPSSPTARVIVNGLALLCFSNRNKRAEVGCLDVAGHDLLFTIYDSDCNIYKDSDGTEVSYVIAEGTKNATIEINSDNPGIGTLFYPADPSDDTSFRHTLNLDRIHDEFGKGRLSIKQNLDFLARLYINSGVFFTEAMSKEKGIIHLYGDESKVIFPPQRVGKIYGADIDDEIVKINITTNLFQKTIELKKSSKPYSIVIRYKCQWEDPTTLTDFQEFYRILNLPAKHQVTDLTYEQPEIPYFHPCEIGLLKMLEKSPELKAELETNKSVAPLISNFMLAREACEGATVPECPLNLEGIPEPCE